jgi:hypothetical protein
LPVAFSAWISAACAEVSCGLGSSPWPSAYGLSPTATTTVSTVRAAATASAGDLLLDAARAGVERSAIAATREVPVLAGVLGERAEVLGAVALVLRESERFVAEPAGVGQA